MFDLATREPSLHFSSDLQEKEQAVKVLSVKEA